MPTFNSFDDGFENKSTVKAEVVSEKASSASFIAKVFLVLFIALIATAVISLGLSAIFSSILNSAIETDNEVLLDNVMMTMIASLVISSIALIIMSIVVPIVYAKGKHSVLPSMIIFVILMGVLLSSLCFALPWYILGEAAAITGGTFGLIALIGLAGKGRIPGIGLLILGLFSGVIILSIINLFMLLLNNPAAFGIDFAIDIIFLAIIMLISIVDVRNIKRISLTATRNDNNVILYSAFMIYVDFIGILVRIASLLARAKK